MVDDERQHHRGARVHDDADVGGDARIGVGEACGGNNHGRFVVDGEGVLGKTKGRECGSDSLDERVAGRELCAAAAAAAAQEEVRKDGNVVAR